MGEAFCKLRQKSWPPVFLNNRVKSPGILATMLRPLQQSDLPLILPWRNEKAVREASFNQHLITEEEHLAWFCALTEDNTRSCLLYSDDQNQPSGVVSFSEIDLHLESALWGFYTKPSSPAGTGLCMLIAAADHAFNKLALHTIRAEVLVNNERSINLHHRLGFQQKGVLRTHQLKSGQETEVIGFKLTFADWQEKRRPLVTES